MEFRGHAPAPLALPSPRAAAGGMSLELALSRRRSHREFEPHPLTLAEIGQLAWACQGLTDPRGERTAPSAGAIHPLELYVATAEGVFHYDAETHALSTRSGQDTRAALWEASIEQDCLRAAPAIFTLAANPARTVLRYGDRATRYIDLEAGHAAQNLLLQATSLDLWAVPIGAFRDEAVASALSLPPDEQAVYLVAVGHPVRTPGGS